MSSLDYQRETDSIVGVLQDGRTIFRSKDTRIIQWASPVIPPFHVQVNFPKTNIIDAILDINIRTVSPEACVYGICQKKITRHTSAGYPVVGFTVTGITYLSSGITATGVTVTSEVVVIGW